TGRRPRTAEDAGQFAAQYPLPVVVLQAEDERISRKSRVVHQDIEPSVSVNDVLYRDTDRVGVSHVEARRAGRTAGVENARHGLFRGARPLAIADHDRRTGPREADGDRTADPPRRPGYERDLS